MSKNKSGGLYWIYKDRGVPNSKISRFDQYIADRDVKVRGMVVNSEERVEEIFTKRSPSEYEYETIFTSDKVSSFKVKRKVSSSGNVYSGKFLVVKSKFRDTYTILTHEKRENFKYGIKRFIEQYYPLISRPFVPSRKMKDFLDELSGRGEGTIRTDRLVAYENKISKQKNSKQEANVKYTDEPYKESYRKTLADDMYIDKWSIKSSLEENKDFKGFLSRRGIIKCSSNFANFYESIVKQVERHSADLNGLLENREKQEGESKPLKIKYSSEVFSDTSMNKKLISSLNDVKNVSCSVYHGNPYLYMSLVDFRDGSSYDIIVHSDSSIEIRPQTRANSASLSRVINNIFQRFGEGSVEEVET